MVADSFGKAFKTYYKNQVAGQKGNTTKVRNKARKERLVKPG
jgi:hypothetical protein